MKQDFTKAGDTYAVISHGLEILSGSSSPSFPPSHDCLGFTLMSSLETFYTSQSPHPTRQKMYFLLAAVVLSCVSLYICKFFQFRHFPSQNIVVRTQRHKSHKSRSFTSFYSAILAILIHPPFLTGSVAILELVQASKNIVSQHLEWAVAHCMLPLFVNLELKLNQVFR